MSSQPNPAPGSEPEKTNGIKNTSSALWYGILVAVILFGIFLIIIGVGRKSHPVTDDQSNNSISNSSQVVSANTYLPIPDKTFEISDSWSNWKRIPSGYYYSFMCNEAYEVRNQAGKIVSAEANTSASLGIYHDEESTANSLLQFRTKNNSTATMIIEFTPMKLTNN